MSEALKPDIVAKLEHWAGTLDQQLAKHEVDTLYDAISEIERLRAALLEARYYVGSWGAYASPYFQEKWDLEGNIARIDAALSPLPAKKGGTVD